MKSQRRPVFLARSAYRRRRMRDLARMLPVFGTFLVLLPVLWAPAETDTRDTAPDGIYLFLVWAVLIAVAAFLAAKLSGAGPDEPASEPEERE